MQAGRLCYFLGDGGVAISGRDRFHSVPNFSELARRVRILNSPRCERGGMNGDADGTRPYQRPARRSLVGLSQPRQGRQTG